MKKEFLAKAEQNLRAAELLFENGLYDASANRSYYAALHAAVAALSGAGIKTERISHDTVQFFSETDPEAENLSGPSEIISFGFAAGQRSCGLQSEVCLKESGIKTIEQGKRICHKNNTGGGKCLISNRWN